jgi:peptide/nickel transport system permease protein
MAALLPRLAFAALSVLAAASLAFLLVRLAPGGGGAALALASGGEHGGAAGLAEELARAQGLDRPILAQWLSWLGGLARGDLGWSWRAGAPVAALIAERLPVTLALMLPGVLLGAAMGLGLGLAASALRPGGVAARGGAAALNALHALPVFVLAQLLVLGLALRAGLLPVQGLEDPRAPPVQGLPAQAALWARHLALPVLSLALHQLCLMALLARAGIAAELARPYALAARARGNGPWRLRRRHALPNAAPPLVALLGVRLGGGLIGGAVVIETVFALPGLGRLAVGAALARDHAVVVGVVLLASAATVAANLLADAVLAWRDPLRRGGAGAAAP